MSKFLVFSDLHAHPFRQFSVNGSRLNNCLRVVEDVFRIAYENGCTHILFCGDWFHEPGKISTIALNKSIEVLNSMHGTYPDIQIIGISGNHDQQGRNTLDTPSQTAMESLSRAVPNLTLWDNCADTVDGVHVCGIPYYEFSEDFSRVLEGMVKSIPKNTSSILMMHQVLSGGVDPIPVQIDSEDTKFDGFSIIFNGHIHRTQDIRGTGMVNVGSPLHQDLGDIGQTKFYIIYDSETTMFLRKPFIGYPQFRRLKYGEQPQMGWENDYIVQDPPPVDESKGVENIGNFSTANAPRDIVKSYGEHHNIEPELLNVGVSLL